MHIYSVKTESYYLVKECIQTQLKETINYKCFETTGNGVNTNKTAFENASQMIWTTLRQPVGKHACLN